VKRTFWAGFGYTLGLGTSFVVQKRVRRTVERYAPEQVRNDVANRGRAVANRAREVVVDLRDAAQVGAQAVRDERAALLDEFAADDALHSGPARGLGNSSNSDYRFRPRR